MLYSYMIMAILAGTCSPASCFPHDGHPHSTPSPSKPAPSTITTLTTRTTNTMAESCTTRPTQTYLATQGCEIACSRNLMCIADYAVTVRCGCTSVAVRPVTTTVCPTNTNCFQCLTGWGIITMSETGCSAATATATEGVV